MSLREENKLMNEIMTEAGKRYPKQGYDQYELLQIAFEEIEKRIDEKIKSIENRPDFYNDTAYEYGRRILVQVKEMLK